MKIKREVRCLYLLLLREGKVLDLEKIISFYSKYNKFCSWAENESGLPAVFKRVLVPIGKPKYLDWAKKYMKKGKKK